MQGDDVTAHPVSVGVTGAGQMGRGIAEAAAVSGHDVVLFDPSDAARERAAGLVAGSLGRAVEKGKLDRAAADRALGAVRVSADLGELAGCGVVCEAAAEDEEVKKSLFRELGGVLPKGALVTTNTSSVSITRLASYYREPERVCGVHFMNPVPVMRLVEVIRGLSTSTETAREAREFAERLGKTVVEASDSPGFLVNRMIAPMLNEAVFLLAEGAAKEDIDRAMVLGLNHPAGPLALADFIGLDTLLSILRVLHADLGEDKYRPCPLLVRYVDAGRTGKKSGRGFYDYGRGGG